MSLSANISEKAALIWAIADKLTGVYKPHEYGEVILPLTVIRRFDCILADTKDAVLEKFETVKNLPMRDVLLRNASGKAFYNTSKFTFERLLDDPDNIEANFRDYLNGFSENVQDILEKFKFDGQITTMANKGILYSDYYEGNMVKAICSYREEKSVDLTDPDFLFSILTDYCIPHIYLTYFHVVNEKSIDWLDNFEDDTSFGALNVRRDRNTKTVRNN